MSDLFRLPEHMVHKRKPSSKPRQYPEQDLQIAVADSLAWMLLPEFGVFWKAVDHSYHGQQRGYRLKRMGVKAGPPDIDIIFQGKYHGIELKTATGVLSEAQKRIHAEIRRAGGEVAVCRSLEGVFDQIDRWGIPRLTVKPSALVFASTASLEKNSPGAAVSSPR